MCPASTISEASERPICQSESTSSAAAFHAKTLALPEMVQDSLESGADCGVNTHALLAKFDLSSQLWKTSQLCLEGGLETFSGTWPRSGMTRSGIAYQLPPLVPLTSGTAYGLLPTPTVNGNHNRKGASKTSGDGFITALKRRLPTLGANESKGSSHKRYVGSTHFHGAKMSEGLRTTSDDPIYLNPCFAELVMGYPPGWTHLETPSSRKSRKSSGGQL